MPRPTPTIAEALALYGLAHEKHAAGAALLAQAGDLFAKAHDAINRACPEPAGSRLASAEEIHPATKDPRGWKTAKQIADGITAPDNVTGRLRGSWVRGAIARRDGLPREAPFNDDRGGFRGAWYAGWDSLK